MLPPESSQSRFGWQRLPGPERLHPPERVHLIFWEVAERLLEGSHGLEPTEQWWGKGARRGATREPRSQSSPSSVAPRRPVFALPPRGLKPAATVKPRSARQNRQRPAA